MAFKLSGLLYNASSHTSSVSRSSPLTRLH
nr:MAG TPA: hypothetical protein [Caudoviricetes sp.]DAQ75745.1 MAG TPA: hypothetical protein [Caudoviricetes sp.]